jgi:hypothetical protein
VDRGRCGIAIGEVAIGGRAIGGRAIGDRGGEKGMRREGRIEKGEGSL